MPTGSESSMYLVAMESENFYDPYERKSSKQVND